MALTLMGSNKVPTGSQVEETQAAMILQDYGMNRETGTVTANRLKVCRVFVGT